MDKFLWGWIFRNVSATFFVITFTQVITAGCSVPRDASFCKVFARAKQIPAPFRYTAYEETVPYKESASCIFA